MRNFHPFIPVVITGLMIFTACNQGARTRLRAEGGDPQAMLEYGNYLIAKRPRDFFLDYEEGREWIEKFANKGSKEAMEGLGAFYAAGYRTEDKQKAVFWYTSAAEHNERRAMLKLVNAHRYGQLGLPIDESKAAYWEARFKKAGDVEALAPHIKAAATGKAESMRQLAWMYEKGLQEDHSKEAVEWYTKSAEAGDREARMRLTNAYGHGELGLQKDPAQSHFWFQKWQESMRAEPKR